MDCTRCMELISARLDDPLTPEEEQARRAHLAHCPACRAVEGQLAALHGAFVELEDLSAPDDFVQRVLTRIQAETRPSPLPLRRSIFKTWGRSLAGLAACALLCIGLYRADLLPGSDNGASTPTAALYSMESEGSEPMPDPSNNVPAPALVPEAPRSRACEEQALPSPAAADTDAQETLDKSVIYAESAPEEYAFASTPAPSLTLSRLPDGWEEILSLEDALPARPEELARYSVTREQANALFALSQNQDITASLSAPLDTDAQWTVILASEG